MKNKEKQCLKVFDLQKCEIHITSQEESCGSTCPDLSIPSTLFDALVLL